MLGKVFSVTLAGIEGRLVQVEADISDGLPSFDMVGIPGSEVREARERVRTAFHNCGIYLPPKRVTINLSPADIRKKGSGFDLPLAVSIIAAMDLLPLEFWNSLNTTSIFCGELSLDGSLCPTNGILAMVMTARDQGFSLCFVPLANAKEAACVKDIRVVGVRNLSEMIHILQDPASLEHAIIPAREWTDIKREGQLKIHPSSRKDFSEVNQQFAARRAAEIAVSGMHNLLMTGPPGSGKSMIAQRIPTIMPPLTYEESLELTRIYSVSGLLSPDQGLLTERPYRAPHHTTSPSALIGGGFYPTPGEISLADRGVLFLDEIPEFRRQTLEALRQPMENHTVSISRIHGRYQFPAHGMIVCAMNPCPCGYYPDPTRCRCTSWEIQRYQNTLSGPFLDRIDLSVEILPLSHKDIYIEDTQNESSAQIQERVCMVHEIQHKRFQDKGLLFNSQMNSSMVKHYCRPDSQGQKFLDTLNQDFSFSTRGFFKLLKTARTIADMEQKDMIGEKHLIEALCYRTENLSSIR